MLSSFLQKVFLYVFIFVEVCNDYVYIYIYIYVCISTYLFYSLQNKKQHFKHPLAVAPVRRQLAKGLEEDSQRQQLFQRKTVCQVTLGKVEPPTFHQVPTFPPTFCWGTLLERFLERIFHDFLGSFWDVLKLQDFQPDLRKNMRGKTWCNM